MHFDTSRNCGGDNGIASITRLVYFRLTVLLRDTDTDLIPVIILEINFTYNLSEH